MASSSQSSVLFAAGLCVASAVLLAGQGTSQERIQELEKQLIAEQQKARVAGQDTNRERIEALRTQLFEEYRKEEAEYWPRRAAALKSKGQFADTVRVLSQPIGVDGLSRAMSESSVIVATPMGDGIPVAVGHSIVTWRSFRVIQTLSEKAPPPDRCASEMDSTIPSAIPRDELAIPFPGGTLTIDGVTFTYVELEAGPWPTSGVRYLMFVRRCGNASAHLAYTFDSLYPVTTDGTILPSEGSPRSGLSRELVQIGTVQRLRDHLTRVQ